MIITAGLYHSLFSINIKPCIHSQFHLPDFITVVIPSENTASDESKEIIVEILNRAIVKPFLGGYVDKTTGIQYFDALTQTGPVINRVERYSRESQTHELTYKGTETMVDETMQTNGSATDNYIFTSEATDFIIIPRKYQTYAQKKREENKLNKIILIQRNFRKYLLRQFIKRCAAEYR